MHNTKEKMKKLNRNYTRTPLGHQDFKSFLQTNFNLLKISINGFEEIFEYLYEDIKKLKEVPLKPDRKTALALMQYLEMKDQKTKELVQILCGENLQKYFDWIENYCKEHKYTRGQLLRRILKGKI